MPKILWVDLHPFAVGERDRLEARLAKLARVENAVDKASLAFAQIRRPEQLRIRPGFTVRSEPAQAQGDLSDRLLPPRRERPPATRLTSPRGIALKVYLTALFVAQTRSPGERPGNKMPLADPDTVSWIDLIATPAERGGTLTYSNVRHKKVRQLQDALLRLSQPEVQLVELPNFRSKPTGKYEGFLLMHEGGAPYEGGDNAPYTVPPEHGQMLLRVPPGLFLNGWIHVLEDSELAFLLMLTCLRARFSDKPVFAASEIRLLQFGLSRDAYQAHHMLNRLGLIDVEEDPNRHMEGGRAHGFTKDNPPKLHRFQLINDGFEQEAIPTMRRAIARRLGRVDVFGRPVIAGATPAL
jgi:hypothetical protein